ncbi:CRP/FNR family transcriptional regulator, anaerobic regulatory protein [Candidatus Electrothrix aarhusensis]|uniref:CRP/FNR family transcriptional regulator, anaerobic regulatory protein n=1 Tax=Candidatus Electrothrix aarhusensis TaxID=1859131 RepID=A0A3S3SHY2_9BACT|nr:CRP/FNR family transcriptional regulator, anaerobic regulatory protein [Candidatus Electrothrix aarhusensis]
MIERTEKKTLLAGSILFQGLSNELINRLVSISRQKQYCKGETIFLEGRPSHGFYLIIQGQVKIFKASAEGKEQTFYTFGPGEPFGLTTLFLNKKSPACATSMVPTTVLFFPKEKLLQLTVDHPPLALSMLSGLSQRLCQLVEKIGSLALHGAPHRLSAHLIYLAEQQGRTDQVFLDMPKKQLACLLGTTPENLSRIFADMSNEGLIKMNGKCVQLLRYRKLLQHK